MAYPASVHRIGFMAATMLVAGAAFAAGRAGADLPWTTYEAEAMKTNGAVLGPKYGPFLVEMEASGQKCVKLAGAGDYVEFTATTEANALVIRYSLPDAEKGGGVETSLRLL